MAKEIKIDKVLKKRFTYKNKTKRPTKKLVTYFLIVCEGEKTEPNYFKAFPKEAGTIVYDIQFDGGGINTLKVVEKAIELRDKSRQKYDRVWAVFDRDSFRSNSFNSAILKAKANSIECAWSNEAFELWYLLHFHNRITAMPRKEYEKAIEYAINEKNENKKKQFKYKKNDPNMYSVLDKFGSQDLAIKWAKDLATTVQGENFADFNPVTKVFELVEELVGKSEKLNQEIIQKYSEGK